MLLSRLLLRERWRKLNLHYGRAGFATAGLMLLLLFWTGAAFAAEYMRQADADMIETISIALWIVWTIGAASTGKDLSWRINLERILIFPSPGFPRLYTLAFTLGYLSAPMLACLSAVTFCYCARAGFRPGGIPAAWIGYLLLAASVRLSASLVRVVLHRIRYLPRFLAIVITLAVALVSASTLASMTWSRARIFHPGSLFGLVISGAAPFYPLLGMGIWTAMLYLADFLVQRHLAFSGIRDPLAPNVHRTVGSNCFMLHPTWPCPLFRVGVCGWLRSRSALLLFIWGAGYSFLWTYYSRPDDAYFFFLFIWMNLLFHAYLRGNLLGTDRRGAWIYYMFPSPIHRAMSSKGLSLSLLQGCMIAALMTAGVLWTSVPLGFIAWSRILSYAVSGILFGETCGLFFSIRYPDSIDRNSQFDGGMTVGALAVPVLQLAFLFLFMLASGGVQPFQQKATHWGVLLAAPLFLFWVRLGVLKFWVPKAMLENREIILNKLTG
jgi:hypothetical protein